MATDLSYLLELVSPRFRPAAEVNFLAVLEAIKQHDIKDLAEEAYIFATMHHESACGHWMEEIWQDSPAQLGYEGRADLGNNEPGDGYRFRGRGFVQLTGRKNYRDWSERLNLDLTAEPDLAKAPMHAAEILVLGMKLGTFRSAKLSDFHQGVGYDFVAARDIINGDKDRVLADTGMTIGRHIAERAESYQMALRLSGQ